MATLSGLTPASSAAGVACSRKRVRSSLALLVLHYKDGRFLRYQRKCIGIKSVKRNFHFKKGVDILSNSYVGRNHHMNLSFDDGLDKEEPFWLNFIKQAFWAIKSLLEFLVEQPSQLKYIEWPSFQSTLKTASFTLVLVGLLIVALASVDSALSYLLALLLRRKA